MTKPSKKYLMKRRRFGYGWTPSTWQGWLFILLQLGIVAVAATFLPMKPAQPTPDELLRFILIFAFALTSLILISIFTAPKPKWRWGKKESDNPDEDF